jgi:hypothetical protein
VPPAGPRRREERWHQWSVARAEARRAVRANEARLRAVTCWDGRGEAPFGMRDRIPRAPAPVPGDTLPASAASAATRAPQERAAAARAADDALLAPR